MTRPIGVRQGLMPSCTAVPGSLALDRFTRPVLFYIPSDCACTDYSNKIYGFVAFSPLRNREPERAADHLLEDLRDGRKSAFAELKPSVRIRISAADSLEVNNRRLKGGRLLGARMRQHSLR